MCELVLTVIDPLFVVLLITDKEQIPRFISVPAYTVVGLQIKWVDPK